jgi:hypothetical protein
MPFKTVLAGLAAAASLGACAGGPHTAAVPAGLTYECDPGGLATIIFNGGGYLPDSGVWGTNDKGERVQLARSAAELHYDGRHHRMVAEVAPSGLRYRSADKHDGEHYLVWSSGVAGEGTSPEDAALTLRSDPAAGEPVEREIARCARSGRSHSTQEPRDARHEPSPSGDPPHAP